MNNNYLGIKKEKVILSEKQMLDIEDDRIKLTDSNEDYLPMCKRGWNRGEHGYSIFRGNLSNKGVCRLCYRRARKGLSGLEYKK